MGIYEEFDEVILSHEVGLTKDDPKIFQVALSRLQLEPQEAIFIDDFAAYVEVARSVGMQAILYTGASALTASLKNFGIQ
jgi:HAD superfamily hydrolase (TIGR01509 family)